MVTEDYNELFLVVSVDVIRNKVELKSLKDSKTYEVSQDRDFIEHAYKTIEGGLILSNAQVGLNHLNDPIKW